MSERYYPRFGHFRSQDGKDDTDDNCRPCIIVSDNRVVPLDGDSGNMLFAHDGIRPADDANALVGGFSHDADACDPDKFKAPSSPKAPPPEAAKRTKIARPAKAPK